ncbi:MAG: site-specific integrase [Clostridia bacterium]|nr:site-specific integrase [Clostridia bacterium]
MTGRLAIKNGKYYVIISYKDEHGKNKQKWTATGLDAKNNKRAAEEVMREIVANFNNEETPTTKTKTAVKDKMLFGDYLIKWIEIAKPNLQTSTYAGYKGKIKNIAPYFNERGITLQNMKPTDIQAYYAWLMENGKTIQACTHAHVIIRRALEIAYRTDLIPVNPAAKVEKPKSPKYEAKYYDLKQLRTLFEYLKGDKYELMYKMTAFYGLRRSELCGMKWNSIDFDKNTITLNSSVVQTCVNNKLVLIKKDIMKNASSKRTMPLIPEIKEALLKLKEQQDKNKAYFKNGYNQQYLDYVWVDDIGKLVNPNTVTCHFKSFLAQHGLPKIRFHELRHSCASLLIACGISMKEIQEWLGHSAISTTADIYSHLNYSSKLNVANTLTNVFGGTTMNLVRQDDEEAKALLTALFRGAEHEQAEDVDKLQDEPLEAVESVTDEFTDTIEEDAEPTIDLHSDEDFAALEQSVNEYKKAKAEMQRLGFTNYDEYLDYLEFTQRKAARKSNMQM